MDEKRAITAALSLRWPDALKLNKQIIRVDPNNVDALARLARAYMELGKSHLAKKYYSLVLKSDPYNPIAIKNLKIIKAFKSNGYHPQSNGYPPLTASLFLQEPGKTKVVNLLNVAEPKTLSQTFCGMRVKMVVKNHKLVVVSSDGGYLGVLPDDICHLLLRLLKGGNKYDLLIKAIRVNSLSVLIRETFRSKKFRNQPSFLESTNSSQISAITMPIDHEDGEEETSPESDEPEI